MHVSGQQSKQIGKHWLSCLREGSAALVTQVCGGGEVEWAYAPGGGGGSLAEAAACQAP